MCKLHSTFGLTTGSGCKTSINAKCFWFMYFFNCTVCRFACADNVIEAKSEVHISDINECAQDDKLKPYSCTVCDRRFTRKRFLKVHQRVHSKEKFLCIMCDAQFSQKELLNEHQQIHSGEKPFLCTICGTQFKHRASLIDHKGIHSGEKPFICTVCNRRFRRRSHLNTHLRMHTGEKPFVCSVCDKCFSRKSNLVAHGKRHTAENHRKRRLLNHNAVYTNTLGGRYKYNDSGECNDPAVHGQHDLEAADKTQCSYNDQQSGLFFLLTHYALYSLYSLSAYGIGFLFICCKCCHTALMLHELYLNKSVKPMHRVYICVSSVIVKRETDDSDINAGCSHDNQPSTGMSAILLLLLVMTLTRFFKIQ